MAGGVQDAKVALDVHTMRENHPDWFLSQMGNKLWYTGLGAGETLSHSCSDLASSLVVECDGKRLELPADIEGILILNINSFMGGVNLWRSTPERPVPPQGLHDQLLEVVGIYGSLHMGKLQVGLAHAPCLTQCSTVRITTLDELPMQVDGEPWIMPKSTMIVRHHNQVSLQSQSKSILYCALYCCGAVQVARRWMRGVEGKPGRVAGACRPGC